MDPAATIVFQSRRRRDCAERALVLQALNIPHGMQADGMGWSLWVHGQYIEPALAELRLYEDERKTERLRPAEGPRVQSLGREGVLAFVFLMVLFYPAGQYGLFGWNFWNAGRMDSQAVLAGDWWRPITALFLHADLGHLVANLFFGALFATLTSHLLGAGITWAATLAAGALGNTLTTFVHGPGHLAIGASTAVFGTLGIFTFYEWVRRRRQRLRMTQTQRLRIVAPLFGGAVLLGWLGMGGGDGEQRVDVLSHVTGFVAGSVLGALMAWRDWPERLPARSQSIAAIAAMVVATAAWIAALTA